MAVLHLSIHLPFHNNLSDSCESKHLQGAKDAEAAYELAVEVVVVLGDGQEEALDASEELPVCWLCKALTITLPHSGVFTNMLGQLLAGASTANPVMCCHTTP